MTYVRWVDKDKTEGRFFVLLSAVEAVDNAGVVTRINNPPGTVTVTSEDQLRQFGYGWLKITKTEYMRIRERLTAPRYDPTAYFTGKTSGKQA